MPMTISWNARRLDVVKRHWNGDKEIGIITKS